MKIRVRRVRQLGVSGFTYPGAEHSRFAHSLGVMNFAQRIMAKLKNRYRYDSTASDLLTQHERTVKAAALIHDIGHGPYSHMMAEQLVIARMRMSLQVYFHKTTRGWEAHLLCLFNRAAEFAKDARLPNATPEVVRRIFADEGKLSHRDF